MNMDTVWSEYVPNTVTVYAALQYLAENNPSGKRYNFESPSTK